MGFDFQLVQPQAFIRMHFIADFLIKSIIRTRLFNVYDGTERHNPRKTHETPPQNCLQRGSFMSLNSRKALFQAVFGHRKSPP